MTKQAIITENSKEYLISYDKNGKEKKRYCLEVDPQIFTPKHPGDICPEYMLRFCKAKGLADLEWYVKILDEQIEKTLPSKITDVVKTVKRKRTPSEVRQEFIKKYFPDMKRVKDEEYQGHTTKAMKLLEEMRAAQPSSPKKAPTKE